MKAPEGLGEAGQRLWDSVADHYELEEHEGALLGQACSTLDLCTRLEAILLAEGPIANTPHGQKPHPAAVELRQQRIALARLVFALRLPVGEEGEEKSSSRPRRNALRGVYSVVRA